LGNRYDGGGGAICTTATLYSQQTTPNTSTTRHHSVDANDDTLLVAVAAVTDADDTSAAVVDDHASKQSTLAEKILLASLKEPTGTPHAGRYAIALTNSMDTRLHVHFYHQHFCSIGQYNIARQMMDQSSKDKLILIRSPSSAGYE
jgi:hypothetical protein